LRPARRDGVGDDGAVAQRVVAREGLVAQGVLHDHGPSQRVVGRARAGIAQRVGDDDPVPQCVVDVLGQDIAVVGGRTAGVILDDTDQAIQPVVLVARAHAVTIVDSDPVASSIVGVVGDVARCVCAGASPVKGI
jgi:hypothetical protein